jgi:hypothetical protein
VPVRALGWARRKGVFRSGRARGETVLQPGGARDGAATVSSNVDASVVGCPPARQARHRGSRGALGRPPASEGRGEAARRAAGGRGRVAMAVAACWWCRSVLSQSGTKMGHGEACAGAPCSSTRDSGRSGLGSPIGCGAVVGAAQRCRR